MPRHRCRLVNWGVRPVVAGALRADPPAAPIGGDTSHRFKVREGEVGQRLQVLDRARPITGEAGTESASIDVLTRAIAASAVRVRLHGDGVLERVAWNVADTLGWPDTFDAEYVALTQLHADAFVTLDRRPAGLIEELVVVASVEDLY